VWALRIFGYRGGMKTTWVVIALALVGCSTKEAPGGGGAPAGDPCSTAINQAVDKMIAKSNRDAKAPTPMIEIANKLRKIMTERCKADGWSESALACFRAATDQPSIKACRQGLPQDQSQRLQQEIMKVMTGGPGGMGGGGAPPHGGGAMAPHGGGGGAMPPATPPPAGSASGS
jgi:hypothetical protein